DALARQQFATRQVALLGLGPAAFGNAHQQLAQFRHQRLHRRAVNCIFRRIAVDLTVENTHGCISFYRCASTGIVEQFTTDQHAPNFAGACADLVPVCLAPAAAGRVGVDLTLAPEAQNRLPRQPVTLLCGIENHTRTILAHLTNVSATHRIKILADAVKIGATCLQRAVHISDLALDELELADALAELLAVMNVGRDDIHRRLHQAHGATAQDSTFVIPAAHQHLGAFSEAAENVFLRDFIVVEYQLAGVRATHAELVELLRNGEAWGIGIQNKGSHAL